MQTQNVIRSYEPTPHNGRNSFYGKCGIIETADGCRYLRSYATIVAYIDSTGKAHRTWGGWSQTAGAHLQTIGIMNKKEWDSLPVEPLPGNWNISIY